MPEILNERLIKCKRSFNSSKLKCEAVTLANQKQGFSDRLRAAMAHAGIMRPTDLARKMGASPQLVNKWLTGTTQNIRAIDLFRLGETLKVSTRWLLHGTGNMGQYQSLTTEQREVLEIFNALPCEWRSDWVHNGRSILTRLSSSASTAMPFPNTPPPPKTKTK
jgi:transcriptional regulator with XRE-family HTH domain